MAQDSDDATTIGAVSPTPSVAPAQHHAATTLFQATAGETLLRDGPKTKIISEVVPFEIKNVVEQDTSIAKLELFPKTSPTKVSDAVIVKGRRRKRGIPKAIDDDAACINLYLQNMVTDDSELPIEDRVLNELERILIVKGYRSTLEIDIGKNSDRSLPLLTALHEKVLSGIIGEASELFKASEKIAKKTGQRPPVELLAKHCDMPLDKAKFLWERANHAKYLMIQYNVGLVHHCAILLKDQCPRRVYGALLVEGVGSKGLERAVEKFVYIPGCRFAPYARIWIQSIMKRTIAASKSAICVPFDIRMIVHKINEAKHILNNGHGGNSYESIARVSNLPVDKVKKYINVSTNQLSLERLKYKGRNSDPYESLVDQIAVSRTDPVEEEYQEKVKNAADVALSILDNRERDIIIRRYGIDRVKPMTYTAIGKVYNVTSERIKQLEKATMEKLRKVWKTTLLSAEIF